MNTVKFETGATSHAVNDLILYTDNTRSLAEERDRIYKIFADEGETPKIQDISQLYRKAKNEYLKEFPSPNYKNLHIRQMTGKEIEEYCNLYIADFPTWKEEHK